MPGRLWAVVSISCGSVLYTLDGGIANVALPTIAEALHIPSASAVMVVSAYNLVLAMALLPFAAFGERYGHARVFRAGLIGYLLASTGCLFADSLTMLLVLRAVQALAAASLLSVSLAMVRMVYPATMLGRGLGLNTMASTLGAAIAPPVGGLLIAHAPWQVLFAAGIPLALIGLAASPALPPSETHDRAYDRAGALLCALTFGLLIAGLQSLSQGVPLTIALPVIFAGAMAGVLFVRHEHSASAPVLPVDLLRQPAMALSVLGALFAVLASTALMLDLPFRLHAMGFGSTAIGAMIAPYAIAIMIVAPSSGMLSDKFSPTRLGSIGMTIALLGMLSFVLLPAVPTVGEVAWRMALCGVGFSLFFSPNGRLVVGSVPRERAAGASSLLSTTRMFGQALGSTGVAGLLALRLPPGSATLAATGLVVISLLCSLGRGMIKSGAPAR